MPRGAGARSDAWRCPGKTAAAQAKRRILLLYRPAWRA